MKFFVFLAVLCSAVLSCAPSPCQQLLETWQQCWCEGITPSTTRPQSSIDEACSSPDAFLNAEADTVPDPEREAIRRCNEADAEWAQKRLEASECRSGGSYVCGGSSAAEACYPPS